MRELIGESRYRDYERVRDPAYKGMGQFAERNGITSEQVRNIYEVLTVAEQQATMARISADIGDDDRRGQALSGIRKETEEALSRILSTEELNAFLRDGASRWVNELESMAPAVRTENLTWSIMAPTP